MWNKARLPFLQGPGKEQNSVSQSVTIRETAETVVSLWAVQPVGSEPDSGSVMYLLGKPGKIT